MSGSSKNIPLPVLPSASSHLLRNFEYVGGAVLEAQERMARRPNPRYGQEVAAPLRNISAGGHQVGANEVGLDRGLF